MEWRRFEHIKLFSLNEINHHRSHHQQRHHRNRDYYHYRLLYTNININIIHIHFCFCTRLCGSYAFILVPYICAEMFMNSSKTTFFLIFIKNPGSTEPCHINNEKNGILHKCFGWKTFTTLCIENRKKKKLGINFNYNSVYVPTSI